MEVMDIVNQEYSGNSTSPLSSSWLPRLGVFKKGDDKHFEKLYHRDDSVEVTFQYAPHFLNLSSESLRIRTLVNPLMPGGNKKVTHT